MHVGLCLQTKERMVREIQQVAMASDTREVSLSPEDIPGTNLSAPYEKHTVSSLRWWLLCSPLDLG